MSIGHDITRAESVTVYEKDGEIYYKTETAKGEVGLVYKDIDGNRVLMDKIEAKELDIREENRLICSAEGIPLEE